MSFSFFFHKNGVTVPALHFSEACVEMFKEQLSIQTLFQTRETLIPICVLPAIDCELTEWSQWSECNKSCGKGHMIRTRMIQMEPQFGGAPCPETVQRKKCRIRKCLRNPSLQNLRWREARESRRSEQLREESDGDQFPGTAPKCAPHSESASQNDPNHDRLGALPGSTAGHSINFPSNLIQTQTLSSTCG